ncbi:MAG: XRE family transcriptional regulator [Thermoplasmatales archaeon]|nr:XRE family transcriptional regulator [Thermoplasmatales archaeon]
MKIEYIYDEKGKKKKVIIPIEMWKEIKKKIENEKKMRKSFSFSWEGGLKDIKNKYASVELQHKSMEWR